MLSQSQSKYIRSLGQQKIRQQSGLFVAEGAKIVLELLQQQIPIEQLVITEAFEQKHATQLQAINPSKITRVTEEELTHTASLKTASQALAVVPQPSYHVPNVVDTWALALDNIQDPGNMGSIIRVADWFGIPYVIAGEQSVDFFNPKVVQSAMGAHFRVQLLKTNVSPWLAEQHVPIYASVLQGENVFQLSSKTPGIIVIGNESQGISDTIIDLATYKIGIPGGGGAESLNAVVAAGIISAVLING